MGGGGEAPRNLRKFWKLLYSSPVSVREHLLFAYSFFRFGAGVWGIPPPTPAYATECDTRSPLSNESVDEPVVRASVDRWGIDEVGFIAATTVSCMR